MATENPYKNMTWAVLLAQWVEFAQSSLALPDDELGRAFKACVPDIIQLQAVCMSLNDLENLVFQEQYYGLDQARFLLKQHQSNIQRSFQGQPLPPLLAELIEETLAVISAHQTRLQQAQQQQQ